MPRDRSGASRAEKQTASAKHDAKFFLDRKVKEAKNLELTLKLRGQRLAHQATLPKVAKPVYQAGRATKAPGI